MSKCSLFFVSAFVMSAALCASASSLDGFDGDPVYSRIETNGLSFMAVRPFYSSSERGERWHQDVLWPVYTRKGFKDETYGRFLFLGWSQDFSSETDRYRRWLLPIWFQGTSKNGEDYLAVFPFGGKMYEFLGRDRASFLLFPLYASSTINDVQTTSVCWPIGSHTSGDGVERFRVWPFYGTSWLENEFRKKFVLWPFYNSVEYLNDRNPGGGFILIPFYGCIITEHARNYWVLPPFVRWTQSDEQSILHAPWPFIQLADGTMTKRYIWPLYGKKNLGTSTRQFAFWPILWNNKTEYAQHDQHRRLLAPFFSYESDVVTKAHGSWNEGDAKSRYWKLWPLCSWDRRENTSRFRMLDLWPLRDTPGIERNWAPWWTLYKRVKDEKQTGHHILWGLYRQEKHDQGFEWSLLKGLAGYKKENDKLKFRFLFMWFGEEEQP